MDLALIDLELVFTQPTIYFVTILITVGGDVSSGSIRMVKTCVFDGIHTKSRRIVSISDLLRFGVLYVQKYSIR